MFYNEIIGYNYLIIPSKFYFLYKINSIKLVKLIFVILNYE